MSSKKKKSGIIVREKDKGGKVPEADAYLKSEAAMEALRMIKGKKKKRSS